MNMLFFGFFFFFFLIIQTCILPCSSWIFLCFGLELVPVLLFSILYSRYEACAFLALVGLLIDSLSGCVFFTHMFSYIWIYAIVQLFKKLIFLKNFLFVVVAVLISVCIEIGMTILPIFIANGEVVWAEFVLYWKQVVMTLVIVPPLVWTLDVLRRKWVLFVKGTKRKEHSDSYQ